ncbi:hypothetical protein [Paraburkholderia sp. HD33-4]|uniref:hypothetical protein n=1 Tax=Paraburkholderia sp. HD33-4 TaxID=2883242 RepID=UPI001F426DEB|nr:hypothetical protein [Paraburkholderia sp. HD33-4]
MLSQLISRSSVRRACAMCVAVFGLYALLPVCKAADTSAPDAQASVPSGASVDSESGTVSYIDQKNAIVVVDVPGRESLSFNAKDHKDVLSWLQVGDKVTTHYVEPYVTGLTLAAGTPVTHLNRTVKVTQFSPEKKEEGFQAVGTFEGVVEVTGINRKLGLLTFADKSGVARSVKVNRPDLVDTMYSLPRRSHVRITYETTSTVIVQR